MFAGIVQAVHHICVGMGELAELEVDDDQCLEPAVKEQQVYAIPVVTHAQPALPSTKVKSPPSRKFFSSCDQRRFEVAFGIFVLGFGNSGPAGSLISSSGRTASGLFTPPFFSIAALFFDKGCALVELSCRSAAPTGAPSSRRAGFVKKLRASGRPTNKRT